MANSPQEYIDKIYKDSQTTANQMRDQRTQADEEFIKQVNDAIDRATTSSTKPYQSQIEQLPAQYQKLYDTNAVQELVGRRQVQEAMANMGLTDSGLNRTQQTALTLQRGNADADARLAQQQKTQELQDKIAQLIEAGAAQKQQQEASVRNNASNWYNDLQANLYNNALQQGTSQYTAEQERAVAEYQARLEAEAAQKAAQIKAQQQQFDNVLSTISAMEKAGVSGDEMLNYLKFAGNSGVGGASSLYSTYNRAKNLYDTSGIAAMESYINNLVSSGVLADDQAVWLYEMLAPQGSNAQPKDQGMYPAQYYPDYKNISLNLTK